MWRVNKSKVHGSGVFATQQIRKDTRIIEYIGEKISRSEGDKRSEKRIKKYLHSINLKERDFYGFSLLMADSAVVYKKEGFYGDELEKISASLEKDLGFISCDFDLLYDTGKKKNVCRRRSNL